MQTAAPTAWTRRQFLASAPLLATSLHAADPGGWIDCHAHVWSQDTARCPRVPAAPGAANTLADFPPETLMTHAQISGVTRVVLIQRGFYLYDNGYMLKMLEQHPGLYSAVVRVDHTLPGAPAQMRRTAKTCCGGPPRRCFSPDFPSAHHERAVHAPCPMEKLFSAAPWPRA